MPRSGLSALDRAVTQYFAVNDIQAAVLRGIEARGLWSKSRVILIDGRFDGSEVPRPMAAGNFGPPTKKQSYNPRELAEWDRQLTVSIFAVDPTNLQSVRAQTDALEDLIEATIQAMWNAIDPASGKNVGGVGITWQDSLFVVPPVQMAYGRELLLYCSVRMPFFDLPQKTVFPSTGTLTKEFTT